MFKIFKKPTTNLKVRLNSLTNKKFSMNFFIHKNKNEINSSNINKEHNSKCNLYENFGNFNILKNKLSLEKERKINIYKFPKRCYNHLKHSSNPNEKDKLATGNQTINQHSTDPSSISETKDKTNKASIKNVLIYLKPYFTSGDSKKLLIFSFLMTIASKGLITLSPYFLKLTVNAVLAKTTILTPLIFLVVSGISRVIGTAIQEWRQIILNKVSSGAMVSFSKDMMGYLMKLEFSKFKNNSETVVNSFIKSMQGLDRLNRWVIGNVMSNSVEIVIVSLMLYALLGPKYFINTIVTYGIYMLVTKRISKFRQNILREKYKAEVDSENKIYDIVYNIETVKYFQREEKESENFSNIIRGVREKEQKVISSLSLLNTSQNFIISLGMIINLGMGIYDCFNGTMTAGDLVMLNAIFAQIIMPLNFMGSLMREIDETRVNLQYAIDMVDEKQKLIKSENAQLFHFEKGKIEFQNVSFRFPTQNQNHQSKLILDNASVVFEPGTMNAIVGHSGQGKSTLFNLLYKLYDPSSGKILIDNQDISNIENDLYRKHLSICPQNGHLFNESIYYNILYGNLLATEEDIFKITQEVNIYKKINSLSEKFQTNVGTLGSKLSGGERQRLLLARSFIKNSEILLLDEPTSNLDNVNENIILNYIHRIKKDKTILITAHRLSTITQCDMIYVMNKGQFTEIGSHDKLMKNKNGIYYDMFTKHLLNQ